MMRSTKAKSRKSWLEHLEPRTFLTVTPTLLTTITIPGSTGGWQSSLGSYSTSPIFADLFGDSKQEILAAGGDNKLHAYQYNGTTAVEVKTYVQTTPDLLQSTPVVVDTPLGKAVFIGNHSGQVYGWYASTGQMLPGWPRDIHPTAGAAAASETVLSALTAGDIDGDGIKEIIVTGFSHELNVFRYDGTRLFQFNNDDTVSSSPVVGDLNGDGKMEIVSGGDSSPSEFYWTGGRINIISSSGKREVQYKTDQIITSSPALADLDNDGFLDIVVGSGYFYGVDSQGHYPGNYVNAIDRNGNSLPGWPFVTQPSNIDGRVHASPAIADLNGDGSLDVVVADGSGDLIAISANGQELWRKALAPLVQLASTNIWSSPNIADVNGDGHSDVIIGLLGSMMAVDGTTGNLLWQYQTFNQFYTACAAVGQFTGDGSWQLAALGNAVISGGVLGPPAYLTLFNLPSSTITPQWAQFRRDGSNNAIARSDTYNAALIAKLYTNTLGRSASQSEINNWLPTFSRAQNLQTVIMQIAGSVEARQYNIRQWYQQYLNRNPETGGLNSWTQYLATNHSYASCQANIIGSVEAFTYAGGGTNDGWVRFLYQNLMRRTPSNSEVAGWVQALNAGTKTRAGISQFFLLSTEKTIKAALNWYTAFTPGGQSTPTSDSQEAIGWDLRQSRRTEEQTLAYILSSVGDYTATQMEGSWIRTLYQDLLGRPVLANELGYLLSLIENGTPQNTIASMLLNTDEYRKHLVNVLYQQYLGRPASANDQTSWANQLRTGTTNQFTMIRVILASDEYFAHAGGTNAAFINQVYLDLLSRSAPSGVINDWTAYANNGQNIRITLAQTITHANEFFQVQVTNLFLWYLRRYTNTPSDGTRLIPVGSVFANQDFATQLSQGVSPDTIRLIIITAPEYKYTIAYGKATWQGTRWLDNKWLLNGV